MARPRAFVRQGTEAGVYHVMSRVIERQFRLGELEREVFVRMMRSCAALHQVEVLTFCVMSNHFHMLVRVPERPVGFDPPLAEVVALWERAVGREWSRLMRRRHRSFRDNGCEDAIEQWRQKIIARMFSLSAFMKSLKQRFGTWYNRRNERFGTLWEGRYTSVIVENAALSLRTMATYIDLNPVRAGLTKNPVSWRWCGYAEAVRGRSEAVKGLAYVTGTARENGVEDNGGGDGSENPAVATEQLSRKPAAIRRTNVIWAYRQLLGTAGVERVREDGSVIRAGIEESVRRKWKKDQERSIRWEILGERVRNFSAGVIIGSRAFIEEWIDANRWWFGGREPQRRRMGAQPIGRAADWKGLMNLRRLRPDPKRA